MAPASFVVEAPSDPQLDLIARLCGERDLVMPDAVASKTEATVIIGSILRGTYDPADFAFPWGVPFR